jgi:putative membrane protein
MKRQSYKKRAVIHGLSMAVFLGACLGLRADDQGVSAGASVNTDKSTSADVRTDRRNDRDYRADAQSDRDNGKLSRGDASFIKEAAKGGLMEVQMGQYAKDHAGNADVKAYGERLVKDHSQANEKLAKIASEKGVNLAKDTDRGDATKAPKMATDWQGKSGADFDREFIKHAIKDHKEDIKKFEKASRDSKDNDVRSFASDTLPTLREHQMEAERIAKTMGIDTTVSDASEYNHGDHAVSSRAEASGAPGLSVQTGNTSENRVDVPNTDRDAQIKTDVNVDKSGANAEVKTDKGDHKTLGVTTESGDNKTLGVETRKGDGKFLGIQTGPGDGKTLGLNTRKDDGKILGLFPAPGHKKAENRVDVSTDSSGASVNVNADATGGPGSSEKGSASVDHKDKDHSASASASTMAFSDLPSKVQDTIRSEGGDQNVKVKKHSANGKVTYKVTVEKEGRNRVLTINEDGSIVKDNKK